MFYFLIYIIAFIIEQEAGKAIEVFRESIVQFGTDLETKTAEYRALALRDLEEKYENDDDDGEDEDAPFDENEAVHDPEGPEFIDSPATSTDGLTAAAAAMTVDEE